MDGCRADGMRHADQRTCGFYIPLYVYRYLPADTGTLIRQDFPFLIRNRAAFPYSIGNLVLCGLATGRTAVYGPDAGGKLMNRDSVIVESKLKERAGIIGACMLSRSKLFE